jgi:YggT family protein
VVHLICILLWLYGLILFVYVLASWFAMLPGEVGALARRANRLVAPVVEPVLRPIRSVLPPMRMGMAALDLSVLVVFVIIIVLQASIC